MNPDAKTKYLSNKIYIYIYMFWVGLYTIFNTTGTWEMTEHRTYPNVMALPWKAQEKNMWSNLVRDSLLPPCWPPHGPYLDPPPLPLPQSHWWCLRPAIHGLGSGSFLVVFTIWCIAQCSIFHPLKLDPRIAWRGKHKVALIKKYAWQGPLTSSFSSSWTSSCQLHLGLQGGQGRSAQPSWSNQYHPSSDHCSSGMTPVSKHPESPGHSHEVPAVIWSKTGHLVLVPHVFGYTSLVEHSLQAQPVAKKPWQWHISQVPRVHNLYQLWMMARDLKIRNVVSLTAWLYPISNLQWWETGDLVLRDFDARSRKLRRDRGHGSWGMVSNLSITSEHPTQLPFQEIIFLSSWHPFKDTETEKQQQLGVSHCW